MKNNYEKILANIKKMHEGDDEQLDFILSEKRRILVEAPAGYGKTKSMISKLAYLITTGEVPNNKKILALTFSVNAAYKIKRDVRESLSLLIKESVVSNSIENNIYVSNYHGLCMRILKLYGRLIHENLTDINNFTRVNEEELYHIQNNGLTDSEIKLMCDLSNNVKKIRIDRVKQLYDKYIEIVEKNLLPRKIITYNSILMLTIKIFSDYKHVCLFYQKLFPIIIVDEFQDTNYLAIKFISKLINKKKSKIFFLGDPLQRIYGFIGAVPSLFDVAEKKLKMDKIVFQNNYRFRCNDELIKLDKLIRWYFYNYNNNSKIKIDAHIKFNIYKNDDLECRNLITKINNCVQNDNKVAILVRSRFGNTDKILEELENNKASYFYGLFSEDMQIYSQFHQYAFKIIEEKTNSGVKVNKTQLQDAINAIIEHYKKHKFNDDKDKRIVGSLLVLLKIFADSFAKENNILNKTERYELIEFTLKNNGLKQYMEFVQEPVVITTVHGAKGLEWDYVFIPNMESCNFPSYSALCKQCITNRTCIQNKLDCQYKFNTSLQKDFLEELSVFYVALTRAKKDVFLSASNEKDSYGYNRRVSCYAMLPGIQHYRY